jgi:hypothetical protein
VSEYDYGCGVVHEGGDDVFVFDVRTLLDAPTVLAGGFICALDRSGHTVDRQEPELAQQLVWCTPRRAVSQITP